MATKKSRLLYGSGIQGVQLNLSVTDLVKMDLALDAIHGTIFEKYGINWINTPEGQLIDALHKVCAKANVPLVEGSYDFAEFDDCE